MERKNTILLTVIAVATLLVAVVGASFAFFAVDASNNANVEVTATTSADSDVFSATGSGSLALTVTNAVMMKDENEADDIATSATDDNMTISLKAGSGVATCSYYIQYESTGTAYQPTVADTLEYTIAGTDNSVSPQTFEETNIDKASSFGPFTITNTYESEATVQNWTFTSKFYNLEADQTATQLNKSYAGNLTVVDVNCSNAAQ